MLYNLNQINELLKQYTTNKIEIKKSNFIENKTKNNTETKVRNVTIVKY